MIYQSLKKSMIFVTVFLFGLAGWIFPCNPASGGDVCVVIPTLETFASIQAAIDDTDTLNGHTIIVVSGKCIHERITVNKSLTITGEVHPTAPLPVIDGQCGGDIITITADDVIIENLVIENFTDPTSCGTLYSGIKVLSDDNIIRNNQIRNCHRGVSLFGNYTGNEIHDNDIYCNLENYIGIFIAGAPGNSIHHNEVIRTAGVAGTGIELDWAANNNVLFNIADGHNNGILVVCSNYNNIIANQVKNNYYGIYFCPSTCSNIYGNNFYTNNTVNVYVDPSCTICDCN